MEPMERDITGRLLHWKDSRRRKPLLLTGVRQCGKTYTVKSFGQRYFKNLVYLNFEENSRLAGIFEYNFDVERILTEIGRVTHSEPVPGDTLLFLDEIQECPRAITSLKYFCENMPELHIIGAGSLLGVALRSENISFPVGKVNRMRMLPMSFREFVRAAGGADYLETLRDWPTDRTIPELYSAPMERWLKEYYLVGGMPEVVAEWVENHDMEAVFAIQNEILEDYGDDISKHAPVSELEKIRWVWASVPKQLAKENNKFVFSQVKAGKRAAELEDALQWLVDAGLVHRVELVEKVELPLSDAANATYFKVYLSDVGLLGRRCGVAAETILEGNDLYIRHKGALAENYVLNELLAGERTPYFWRSGNTAEIDFLYESGGRIIPVEVKSADNTQAKSYRLFCRQYRPRTGIKASLKNIGENLCEETRTVSLPLYMLWEAERYTAM